VSQHRLQRAQLLPRRIEEVIAFFAEARNLEALRAALDEHDSVAPAFCFDDGLLTGRHASGNRTQFMLECLAELDASLRERGAGSTCAMDIPAGSSPPSPASSVRRPFMSLVTSGRSLADVRSRSRRRSRRSTSSW